MASFPPPDIADLVHQIAALLRAKNETLAVSEAACGGLLSAYLVSVSGALDFYIGGKLVYSLRQRLRLLGWLDAEIGLYMGPLEPVALRLARTTKYELGSTYVLSETGFAGPTTDLHLHSANDQGEVPVGTVFLGLSGPSGEKCRRHETGSADRCRNMEQFARLGLQFLLDTLQES